MAAHAVGDSEIMRTAVVSSPAVHKEISEVYFGMKTGSYRGAINLAQASRIVTLKTVFSSIMIARIQCEVRQGSLVGSEAGDLVPGGHIYVALIPTGKNTDAATGTSSSQVNVVPNKQSFPLSTESQMTRVFDFDLAGYELDLAADPRRQQGVVLWSGNSGVSRSTSSKVELEIIHMTWRVWLECSGNSVLW